MQYVKCSFFVFSCVKQMHTLRYLSPASIEARWVELHAMKAGSDFSVGRPWAGSLFGGRKGIRPVKNRVVRCWCGCLSTAGCRQLYDLHINSMASLKKYFMFLWVIFFTVFCGGRLVVEALGNCPVCPHPHQEKKLGWLGSQVVSVLDSGAEGPGSNRSRDAVG